MFKITIWKCEWEWMIMESIISLKSQPKSKKRIQLIEKNLKVKRFKKKIITETITLIDYYRYTYFIWLLIQNNLKKNQI